MMARQTRDQFKKLNKLTEAQAALGWGVVLILATLLGTIYLTQASRTATVGRRVQILQNELIDLKRENGALEQHIAEAQSLDRLQAEALRQGFIPANPDDVTFLIVPDYPVGEGYDPFAVVPEATAVAPPIGTIEEALYLYFTGQVNALMRGEAREQ